MIFCVIIAAIRSEGLTQFKVTALDEDAEPRDHGLPLIKQRDAFPDYEIVVMTQDGFKTRLGAKPNTLAKDGLDWTLNDPISVAEITGVRLQDQDKVISDAIAEVQITDKSVPQGTIALIFKRSTQRL